MRKYSKPFFTTVYDQERLIQLQTIYVLNRAGYDGACTICKICKTDELLFATHSFTNSRTNREAAKRQDSFHYEGKRPRGNTAGKDSSQLSGRLFSPSDRIHICKKLSHHFLLYWYGIGMGSLE